MNPAAARILDQLQAPDRVGRDLTLLRTRLYRFSDDLRWYVLAEALEEHLLAGRQPQSATISAVRACLEQIRREGSPPVFESALATAEDIDITTALAERGAYMWQQVPLVTPPSAVVIIVGAPRSGTSHLFNLLAATGKFAYLTTDSCWAWPVRNLHQPGRQLFTAVGAAVLKVDNKRTRIIPGLVMPGEAEDIWHRAMPAYRHLHGHRYEIGADVSIGDLGILQAATHAHLAHFQRAQLLAKSPFNSFRIPAIERLWGDAVRYIHIIRDQHEVADSMRRNHFEFVGGGRLLTAEAAWSRFVRSVQRHAPADRTTTISHELLMINPEQAAGLIMDAIA
ncbi:sulfotransferase [Trebonia sp.]|uniref:sulfotransferase n=1 Tax=Trebonia sp. TaxID=2767075 RepID=UPI00261C8CCA|nr:sulfotransferase [Trebonia sp.]